MPEVAVGVGADTSGAGQTIEGSVGELNNQQINLDNSLENGIIGTDGAGEGSDPYALDSNKFVEHLQTNYDFSENDLGRIRNAQEKYGLDNKTLETMIKMEADKIESDHTKQTESVQSELASLSPQEQSEVKAVYEHFMNTLPEGEKANFEKNFTTAQSFRDAKAKMGDNSQGLPDLGGDTALVNNEFTNDDYSDASMAIREANNNYNFDKAEQLTKELKKNIRARGGNKMKTDLAKFING